MNCLLVREANSRAVKRPITVTISAASLRGGAMVMMGVLFGVKLREIISPARMLPHARRLMGLITAGLFSLMGESELNRG